MTAVLTCEDHKLLYTPDPIECRERPVNPCEPGQPRKVDESGNTLECVVYPTHDLAQTGDLADTGTVMDIVGLVVLGALIVAAGLLILAAVMGGLVRVTVGWAGFLAGVLCMVITFVTLRVDGVTVAGVAALAVWVWAIGAHRRDFWISDDPELAVVDRDLKEQGL